MGQVDLDSIDGDVGNRCVGRVMSRAQCETIEKNGDVIWKQAAGGEKCAGGNRQGQGNPSDPRIGQSGFQFQSVPEFGDIVDDGVFELHRAPRGSVGRFELQGGDEVAVDSLLPLDQERQVDVRFPGDERRPDKASQTPQSQQPQDAQHKGALHPAESQQPVQQKLAGKRQKGNERQRHSATDEAYRPPLPAQGRQVGVQRGDFTGHVHQTSSTID